jgi:hypothetical protein
MPFGDWLQRLQAVAYSAADIGTVTPLPGGVERVVRQQCGRLRAQGLSPLILQPRLGHLRDG